MLLLISFELIILINENTITNLENRANHYESYSSTGNVVSSSLLEESLKFSSISELILALERDRYQFHCQSTYASFGRLRFVALCLFILFMNTITVLGLMYYSEVAVRCCGGSYGCQAPVISVVPFLLGPGMAGGQYYIHPSIISLGTPELTVFGS